MQDSHSHSLASLQDNLSNSLVNLQDSLSLLLHSNSLNLDSLLDNLNRDNLFNSNSQYRLEHLFLCRDSKLNHRSCG